MKEKQLTVLTPLQSRIGVTSPFPLASLEGVKAMRAELLQSHVLDNHMMQSNLAGPHAQLRGMASEAARFVHDFWMHPSTLAAVSEAAGEDLVPVFELEVRVSCIRMTRFFFRLTLSSFVLFLQLGHTNIQVPAGTDRRAYLDSLPIDPFAYPRNSTSSDSTSVTAATAEPPKVVGYHRDA